ncbi:hypothetical protein C2S53_015141 [Perilla frutescens var. hirtella]|uniref:Uncharacterized protein n=1 Tax=Perilla frutescens var. hirtella TaxID=608512 RepID=A0AAD4P5S8_PERFH|nr:hypothetical protein C2S53_015141 [Perilla frutescens var. hirtella]
MANMRAVAILVAVLLMMSSCTAEGRILAAVEKKHARKPQNIVDDAGVESSLENHHACSMADFSRGSCDPA